MQPIDETNVKSKAENLKGHVELEICSKEHSKRSKSVEIKIEIEQPCLLSRIKSAPNVFDESMETQNVNFKFK